MADGAVACIGNASQGLGANRRATVLAAAERDEGLPPASPRGTGSAPRRALCLAADLAAGRLMRLLDDFQTIELGVHALHPHGRLAPASVRALLDRRSPRRTHLGRERARDRDDGTFHATHLTWEHEHGD